MLRRIHSGLSVLEMLVTVAVISLLVGLLLPAVQQVRAAAARTACQNNLKQIGLAAHASHDTTGSFPPGLSLQADRSRYPFLGWPARLTPYLDQVPIWQRVEQAFTYDPNRWDIYSSPLQVRLLSIRLRILACPSDPRAPGPALVGIHLVAFTSYMGVEGTNQVARDGMLFSDSAVRLTDISDGTTQTIFVGERPPSADLRFGWWYRGWGQGQEGSAEMVLGVREQNTLGPRYSCPPGPYTYGPGRIDNQCDMFHFWSPHPGGANFLFADGSVRFLTYSADAVLPALATRAGGETVTVPE